MTSPDLSLDDRRYPLRPLLAASLACFRDGAVLLARRGRPPSKSVWSLPGGAVELGETAAEAAAREMLEETGVGAKVVGLIDVIDVIMRDEAGRVERQVAIAAFAGRWLSGEPTPGEEAEAVAWVSPKDIEAYETTAGLAAIVRRAAEIVR